MCCNNFEYNIHLGHPVDLEIAKYKTIKLLPRHRKISPLITWIIRDDDGTVLGTTETHGLEMNDPEIKGILQEAKEAYQYRNRLYVKYDTCKDEYDKLAVLTTIRYDYHT